jgi:outer membrane protein assembly factor BamB
MVADATTVLLGDHQSRLYALDAATGAVRWHVDGPIGATFFPYIALGGGIAAALVPGTKDSSVRLAVYREDIGKLLWSGAEYPSSVRLTVGVNSYAVYIASDEGSPASPPLIAYDPHTGKQLWQYVQLGGIAAVTDDTVIIGNAFIANGKTDNIACFDAMTGTLLWEANGNYSQWYELSASTTAIYVPTTSNPTELAAISTATGRQLWSVKVGNYLPGEVIQEDGVAFAFLVGSQNYLGPNTPDRLVALDAQSGRIYWERDLPDDYS